MCQGSVATFVGKQRLGAEGSKGTQTLICGPWTHGGSGAQLTAEDTIKVGEHDYPSQAVGAPEGKRHFFGVFPMFVPSLSW
jgi:hypothetical protein